MDYGDYYWGSYWDYYKDPFPHSRQMMLAVILSQGDIVAAHDPDTLRVT